MQKKTILIVDDDPMVCEMMSLAVENRGYESHTVQNGQEALACLNQEHPLLVVSDLLMPVMDGQALYETMQAHPALQDIPFVLMSGSATISHIQEAMSPMAVLKKPVHPDQLFALIEQVDNGVTSD